MDPKGEEEHGGDQGSDTEWFLENVETPERMNQMTNFSISAVLGLNSSVRIQYFNEMW